jgi:hypothetical protein
MTDRKIVEEGRKYCPKCDKIKGKYDFHRNGARYDGLQSVCKECRKVKEG